MSEKKFSLALFLFAAILFLWLFSFFLKPFVVAALLVLSTVVFAKTIEEKVVFLPERHREVASASVLTAAFALLIFGPTLYVAFYLVDDISKFDIKIIYAIKDKFIAYIETTPLLPEQLKIKSSEWIGELFSEQFLISQASSIALWSSGFLREIASSFAELLLVLIFYFLLNLFKRDIVRFIEPLISLSVVEKESMAKEVTSAISIVFLTLVGIMLAQGSAFFALMLFFDYDPLILGFFSAVSSIVPIFGTALVWVPVAVNELLEGDIANAVIISLYSWFVMAFLIDNFLRLYLLSKSSQMLKTDYKINEFLLFFSIAAGIATIGFWGFIIGPSITAFFLASARAYKNSNRR